ncbi:putative phospholipase B-like 2 [Oppia nitens]|uniref:putative phospholipase B-like 2 n=1 Tax=Oppia nitens TaxID=1686743 RepID=UPI0023DBB695|nr:putative phospholipase B-like 2 [Oppia nitens]
MKTKILSIILLSILVNNVYLFKYNYITTDGVIHTSHTINGTIPDVTNETVAVLIYENNVNKTGWANLELKTSNRFTDNVQSYMGGVVEGYITGQLIHYNYRNTYENICKNKKFCELLKKFVENNNQFIDTMIKKKSDSNYWHQIDLIYTQLKGLQEGYNRWKVEHKIKNTTETDYLGEIFLINIGPELSTLEEILLNKKIKTRGHCSAIVKPLADGSDLYVSHNTWNTYNSMLRVLKKYSFAFNTIESNFTKLISGHSVSFPSAPGSLLSNDDYYILSSGLVVQETTNENFNMSLLVNIRANNSILEFARNVVANRLANSGKEWTDLFAPYNSGTYNNQFMIVDYKLWKKGTKVADLPNNLLWIIEQFPSLMEAQDVTPVLRTQGYWGSYNVPYFKDLYNISGNADMARKFGPFFTYNGTARATIFRRDHSKIVDMKTLYAFMRYNDFKNDPLSQCSHYNQTCSPPYSADMTIAARNDLNDIKGKYPIDEWSYYGEGATDAKMTNSSMVLNLEMLAVCGPTTEQQPPFQWSKSDLDLNHDGQPDIFNFKPIYVKWYPLRYQFADDIKK